MSPKKKTDKDVILYFFLSWGRTKRLIGCFTLFFLRLFFEPNCIAVKKKKNGKTDIHHFIVLHTLYSRK